MLWWAVIFLAVAMASALLGLGGLGAALPMKLACLISLSLFVFALLAGAASRR